MDRLAWDSAKLEVDRMEAAGLQRPAHPLHPDFPAAVMEPAMAVAEAIAGCCVRDDRYSKRSDPV